MVVSCHDTVVSRHARLDLSLKKIVDYSITFGCKYTFGMKLYTMNVVLSMTQSHYLSIIRHGSHLKNVGHTVSCYHPTVVASHHHTLGQSSEDVVVAKLCAFGLHSMIHILEVFESCSKHLAYGLMAKTHTKNGFLAGISAYHIKQKSCFRRDAGTRT